MPYAVDFNTVSTAGLELSPVAAALAGLRAHEARYFKNKYDHVFTVEPASNARTTIDCRKSDPSITVRARKRSVAAPPNSIKSARGIACTVSTAPSSSDPHLVSLDIGSSSIRALLFDTGARQMEGFGATLPYKIHTTNDGGAEANPDEYAELLEESGVKAQARAPMTPIVKLVFGIDYDKLRLMRRTASGLWSKMFETR